MQQILSPSTLRVLGPLLTAPSFATVEPVPEVEAPQPVEIDREFVALLRANLHAASQHVAMGHEGASFRGCTRPCCIDAARLIPQLEELEAAATDAELDQILDRVLAALEQSLPEAPAARVRIPRGGTSYAVPMAE